jgi:hypothetical protein
MSRFAYCIAFVTTIRSEHLCLRLFPATGRAAGTEDEEKIIRGHFSHMDDGPDDRPPDEPTDTTVGIIDDIRGAHVLG